ncbi:MAG TPA: GWxTD domain-containing protein [Bacteroidetes bacterium]|nr:GWxTD domain-containing protein [Bacteroidota bacterium]
MNFSLKAILIFLLSFPLIGAEQHSEDWFKRGSEFIEKGQSAEAAEIWLQGYKALKAESRVDSRIGFAFIELVTQEKLKDYYLVAQEMYFWALSGAAMQHNQKAIFEERDRWLPIIKEEEQKIWRKAGEDRIVELAEKIRSYWKLVDPTPSTERNERLLEHWERIAYARKKFRKASDSVYGTDARGLIYVRFGEPERKVLKTLGGNRGAIAGIVYRFTRSRKIVDVIDRYNNTPEVEIWFYHTYERQEEPVFYIFGQRLGRENFGLIRSIEELIPKGAFRRTNKRYTGDMLPGAVLQTVYYDQLAPYHSFLYDRAREMNTLWDLYELYGPKVVTYGTFRGNLNKYEMLAFDRVQDTKLITDGDRSTFDRNLIPIDLTLQPVRRLFKNKPVLTVIALSQPEILRKSSSQRRKRYRVSHTLRTKSPDGTIIQERTENLPPVYDNVSVFTIDHMPGGGQSYEFISEVFDMEHAPVYADENYIPETQEVIGYISTEFSSAPPLSTIPDSLELSDLVIGVSTPEEIGSTRLSFPVVPSKKFLRSKQLYTWLEVYHLFLDEKGSSRFTIDFQVYRIGKFSDGRKEMIASRFSFSANSMTAAEYFGIDISNLEPGKYEIVTLVTDELSNRKKERSARFEIVGTGSISNLR